MRLVLADLTHTQQQPGAVPLAAGYLAAYVQARYPDIEIAIYTDPHHLLADLMVKPPDVVGFSLKMWNERLSAYCAREAKRLCPKVLTIAGGPSVPQTLSDAATFFESNEGWCDTVVAGEGEDALDGLIHTLRSPVHSRVELPPCLHIRGTTIENLSDIPSPYLTGWLDPWLAEGWSPIVASQRGCPYSCQFCVSGASEWSHLRPFSLDRVYAEIDYIRQRTTSDTLMLTDENLGILKGRDVDLASYIRASHDNYDWPKYLYVYTSKIVTDWTRQCVELIAPMAEFCQSFQTLHEPTRKAIGRTNQKLDRFLDNVKWAKEQGILTSTEMIFGLPLETRETYIKGIEWLLCSGVKVYSYNLKLLSGSALASAESRQRYGFKTRFRLPDRAYGRYNGEVVAEAEEVVVGSSTFTEADYAYTRRYGLWLEVASGRGYLTECMAEMRKHGVPGEKLVAFLAEHTFEQYPWLRTFADEYSIDAEAELWDSADDCAMPAEAILDGGKSDHRAKLNLVYAESLMGSEIGRRELLDVVWGFARKHGPTADAISDLCEYVYGPLAEHLARFQAKEYR